MGQHLVDAGDAYDFPHDRRKRVRADGDAGGPCQLFGNPYVLRHSGKGAGHAMTLSFTIVTPSYNHAEFLEQTIRSVLGQNYAPLEYIVMDGGSTDGSIDVIERYSSLLTHWQSGQDGGQAAAIQVGFARATGDILGWLNSDDVLLPGALAKVARFFERNPAVETVTGGGYYIDAAGWPAYHKRVNFTLGVRATHDRFRHYRAQESIFQPATFWRRTAYEAVGGIDPSFQFMMDFDLFARLARRQRFAVLPEFLACFRLHGENKALKLQQTFHREYAMWMERNGIDREPALLRRASYFAHHIQSLARKSRWLALERLGRVQRVRVVW